eukprot:761298-Hanusia_phi.AAC.5
MEIKRGSWGLRDREEAWRRQESECIGKVRKGKRCHGCLIRSWSLLKRFERSRDSGSQVYWLEGSGGLVSRSYPLGAWRSEGGGNTICVGVATTCI